jgi:hypothetical protein
MLGKVGGEETVVVPFEVLFWHAPGRAEEKHSKINSRRPVMLVVCKVN